MSEKLAAENQNPLPLKAQDCSVKLGENLHNASGKIEPSLAFSSTKLTILLFLTMVFTKKVYE